MFFDHRMDVSTARLMVTNSSDVFAVPEVRGNRFVVRSLNAGTYGREASVPIDGGSVSSKKLEAALRQVGAFLA